MDSPYQSYAVFLLARIRQLRGDGFSFKETANLMTLEGYQTLRGKALNAGNLRIIVWYAQNQKIKRLNEPAAISGILGLKQRQAA